MCSRRLAIDGGSPAPVKGTVLEAIRANTDWSTFAALLDESGVATTLAGASAVTVFAPVNAQIAPSDVTVLRADPELLQRTVRQHVVDERLPLDVLLSRTSLTTSGGGTLSVTNNGGRLVVDGRVAAAPTEAVDGFVYATSGLFEAPQ